MIADSAWRKHQMPAYHLMAPDRSGITLVNIGVVPSNAKTITDHLAVVPPEALLMLVHFVGLRPTPRFVDFFLSHPYLPSFLLLYSLLSPSFPFPSFSSLPFFPISLFFLF